MWEFNVINMTSKVMWREKDSLHKKDNDMTTEKQFRKIKHSKYILGSPNIWGKLNPKIIRIMYKSKFVQYLVEDILSKLLSIIHIHKTKGDREWERRKESMNRSWPNNKELQKYDKWVWR